MCPFRCDIILTFSWSTTSRESTPLPPRPHPATVREFWDSDCNIVSNSAEQVVCLSSSSFRLLCAFCVPCLLLHYGNGRKSNFRQFQQTIEYYREHQKEMRAHDYIYIHSRAAFVLYALPEIL